MLLKDESKKQMLDGADYCAASGPACACTRTTVIMLQRMPVRIMHTKLWLVCSEKICQVRIARGDVSEEMCQRRCVRKDTADSACRP